MPSLRALLAGGCRVSLVITQPDRPAGRGRRVSRSAVKREALDRGLRVRQPASLSDASLLHDWGDVPDLLVVAAYGLLLPAWLLDWPRLGAVNVHASLLPRWRGASPIQYAILAGDARTGTSLMKMDPGLDTGPVYGQHEIAIRTDDTAGTLHDRLARLGGKLLCEMLPDIVDGTVIPVPQDETRATHAPKIDKSRGVLNWGQTAIELERRVRAFNPWPVCETTAPDGSRMRVWEAAALSGPVDAVAGRVIQAGKRGIDVATGDGVLRIQRLQPSGGRVMSAAAYLNAHPVAGGSLGC